MNFQKRAQTFLRNLILIAICKDQMQHSAMENRVSILDNFFYSELLACYILENKQSKTGEYQPDELNDNSIDNNHEECSYLKKLN